MLKERTTDRWAAKAASAEEWGCASRRSNLPRDDNPYVLAERVAPDSDAERRLADAWFRGWDRVDAELKRSR